jgi:hypothetical protein
MPASHFDVKAMTGRLNLLSAIVQVCTVGGQIKLGHLKFNLRKSDH